MRKGVLSGQAVLEGVLIMFKDVYAVAVNSPEGIRTFSERPAVLSSRLLKIPGVRGIVVLFVMASIGISAMMRSSQYSSEEDEELSTTTLIVTAVVSLALAFGLFKLLPLFLTLSVFSESNRFLFNLVDGVLRIAFVVGYILLISQISDIKRLFAFHGAEHKVIHAYEQGDLSLESARKQSRFLNRCSTTFVMYVLIVAILVFSLTPLNIGFWQLLGVRVLLLVPIISLSYELIRFSSFHADSWVSRILLAPGMWLQRLTVREPSDKQIEVAIAAVKAAQKAAS